MAKIGQKKLTEDVNYLFLNPLFWIACIGWVVIGIPVVCILVLIDEWRDKNGLG